MNTIALLVAVILLSITVVVLLFLLASSLFSALLPDYTIKSLDEEKQLQEMLKNVTDRLEHHNVDYIIAAGTLLGSVRDRNILKHDDDIDLFALKGDKDKIVDLFSNDSTYAIHDCSFGLQLHRKVDPRMFHLDFFLLSEHEDGKLKYSVDDPRSFYLKKCINREFILHDEWNNKQKNCVIGDNKFYCPDNPTRFLQNAYGNDWETRVVIQLKHDDRTSLTTLCNRQLGRLSKYIKSMIY